MLRGRDDLSLPCHSHIQVADSGAVAYSAADLQIVTCITFLLYFHTSHEPAYHNTQPVSHTFLHTPEHTWCKRTHPHEIAAPNPPAPDSSVGLQYGYAKSILILLSKRAR